MAGQFIGINKTEFVNPGEPRIKFWVPELDYHQAEATVRCAYNSHLKKATNPLDIHTPIPPLNNLKGPRIHTASKLDYDSLKPFFCWLPADLIKKTFENSTQFGAIAKSEHGNLFKRFNSPHPAMNVNRLDNNLLMDKVSSSVPAIDGRFTDAYVFITRKSHLIHVDYISPKRNFLQTLQGFITKWGAPKRVIGDSAPSHYAHQVIAYLQMLRIPIWTSEPYYQHQNPFERQYQTFKRIVNQTMDRTNSPPQM